MLRSSPIVRACGSVVCLVVNVALFFYSQGMWYCFLYENIALTHFWSFSLFRSLSLDISSSYVRDKVLTLALSAMTQQQSHICCCDCSTQYHPTLPLPYRAFTLLLRHSSWPSERHESL